MTAKTKTIILRGVRAAGATAVATVAAYVAGPDVAAIVPAGYQFLVAGAIIPALLALEKAIRYGGDPGEGAAPAPGPSTD